MLVLVLEGRSCGETTGVKDQLSRRIVTEATEEVTGTAFCFGERFLLGTK